jgi:hypothetical protein
MRPSGFPPQETSRYTDGFFTAENKRDEILTDKTREEENIAKIKTQKRARRDIHQYVK